MTTQTRGMRQHQPLQPNIMYSRKNKLGRVPRFTSTDKGLEEALNTLGAAINGISIPEVQLINGTQEWRGNSVLLRAERQPPKAAPDLPRGLIVTSTKPPYCPTPPSPPAEGLVRYWVTLGTCNHTPLKNYTEFFDINASTHFILRIKLFTAGSVRVNEFSVEAEDADSYESPDIVFASDGTRPEEVYANIGTVIRKDEDGGTSYSINNYGEGGFMVYEYNTGVTFDETNPVNGGSAVRYDKEIVVIRSALYYD